MRLDRKMVYLNTAFLAILGLGFAIQAAPLPAYAAGKPWEALATERILGMMIGGVGVALWFLRRLTQTPDFKRLALGWLVVNLYVALMIGTLVGIDHPFAVPDESSRPASLLAAVAVHAALAAGFCATVVWRRGEDFRRVFQLVLLTEATLALLAGYGFAVAARSTIFPGGPAAAIRFLGIELAGLAAALAILGNPADGDDRRRLLLGLGAGNGLSAVMTILQLNVWGFASRPGWALVLIQMALAAGSVWAGLQPERDRSPLTRAAVISRMTWSHLLAGAVAGGVALAAPALVVPSWATFLLAVLLALAVATFFVGDLQRDLLRAAGLVAAGPAPEHEEAARQTWLRQVSEAAVQEERNRLARDLHDSIKQQIFGIHVSAAAVQARWESDPEGARKALADVRRSAHEAMVEMQAMLHQLRPEALGTAGLIEALREQCEALGYRTGAEVALELGDPIPDDRLPPGAQQTLFRIAQEALTNVARHARAHQVRVRLGCEEEAVRLQVEDDGQGFDPGKQTAGMGLRNLRERTESLSGHLEVASAPGEGTRISIRVPFAPAAAPASPPLESAIRSERWDRVLSPLIVAVFLVLRDSFFPVFFALSITVWKEWSVRSLLRRFPGAAPRDVDQLQYLSLRNRAILLLGGAGAAGQQFSASGRRVWMLSGVLCLALMVFEMVRLYRWSRPYSWPHWVWPTGWERSGRSAIFLIGIALILAVPLAMGGLRLLLWLRPEVAGFLSLSAAVLLYFLWRRPRRQGASS
jgi:signal transduction histidine kinase